MSGHNVLYDWERLENTLRQKLKADRYRHTLGVTYTACALAMCHGADLTKARIAGLLHDCAKCLPNEEKLRLCDEKHVPVTDFERQHTALLHAKLGPVLAQDEYGVDDPEVLSAICWHTTGRPDMTLLEKIIYIADYIEPDRDQAPNLTEIRKLAFADIDACMEKILSDTVLYLGNKTDAADPMTEKAYAWYCSKNKEKNKKPEEMNGS